MESRNNAPYGENKIFQIWDKETNVSIIRSEADKNCTEIINLEEINKQ
jgi:hypothetical protein